jgi:hypothetical protein
MIAPGFFAGAFRVNEENSLRALIPSGSSVAQALVYFGALFLVALGFFAWAIIFRRPRHRRHSHHHRHKPVARHHWQPEARPRHPTLADAGGLPPVPTEEQSPPPA